MQSTLEEMTLRQQAASLVVVAVTAGFTHRESEQRVRIEALVRDLGIGGVAVGLLLWPTVAFHGVMTILFAACVKAQAGVSPRKRAS